MESLKKVFIIAGICLLLVGAFLLFKSVRSGMEGSSDLYERKIENLAKPPEPLIKNWDKAMSYAEPGREVSVDFEDTQKSVDGMWTQDPSAEYGQPFVLLSFVDDRKKKKSIRIEGVKVTGMYNNVINEGAARVFIEENPSKRVKTIQGAISFTLPAHIPPSRVVNISFSMPVVTLELFPDRTGSFWEDEKERKFYITRPARTTLSVKKSIYSASTAEAQKILEYKDSVEFYERQVKDIRLQKKAKIREGAELQKTGGIVSIVGLMLLFIGLLLGQKQRKNI
jgi:uncharacterized membrane protein